MAAIADPELGKVLLDQRIKKGTIGNVIFLMVLGVPMMLVVIAPNAPTGVRVGFFLFGLSINLFAAIMLWRHWMRVFLQELGIREYRQGHGRSLRYDQVDEMFYTSLRVFMHGSYIQTVQKLALKSERLPGPPLVCTWIFKEADGRAPAEANTAVTRVRDKISARLADRFLERVRREESVEWAPEARITGRGLELVDRGGELVPWRRVSRCEIDQGTCSLWLDAEAKPRLKISTSVPNFYPACSLARRLMNGADRAAVNCDPII